MTQVSVIIPTFNRKECLVDTVRSALNQTFSDFDVVIVDDGSTDESAVAILREFGPDPERAEVLWRQHASTSSGTCGFSFWTSDIALQYIYQPNRGMGAARNRGLQSCHGENVAFLEPEFLWETDHLQQHIDFLEGNPEAWIAHGRLVVGRPPARNGKKRPRAADAMGFEEVVAGNELAASAIVARRRCLELHGGFDENLPSCEDYDLWIRIAAHVPIYVVPGSVVHVKKTSPPPSWSLDRYRVYALEKAFQSGHLTSDQRHRVAEEMVRRCESLVEGYRQRNNTERANFYDRKKKKFEMEVAKLDRSAAAAQNRTARPLPGARADEEFLSPTFEM